MKIKTIIKLADVLDDSRRMPCDMNELDTVYYNSISRHEPIKISEMDIVHLIRAFKKQNKKDYGIANEDLLNANKNLSDRNDWLTNRVQEVLNENQQVHLEKQSIRKSMDSYSVQKENEELENVLKDTIKSNSELIQLNKQLKASLRQVNLTPTVSTEAYDIAWKNNEVLKEQVAYWKKLAEDNFIQSVDDSETSDTFKNKYEELRKTYAVLLEDYNRDTGRDIWKEKYEHEAQMAESWKDAFYKKDAIKGCNYVFSEIPNDCDGQRFTDDLKKYLNKESYKLRVRGQYLDEKTKKTEGWRRYEMGQPMDKSKCLRVYVDVK
jgi:hypothetical protein